MTAKPGAIQVRIVGHRQHPAHCRRSLCLATGTKAVHMPYKGSSQAHMDIIGGQVEMMFDTTSSAMGQIKGGKFRPLAIAGERRSPSCRMCPRWPKPAWQRRRHHHLVRVVCDGRHAPTGGRAARRRTHRGTEAPDVQARIKGLGGDIQPMTPDAFAAMNRAEFERYGKLVRDANIKADVTQWPRRCVWPVLLGRPQWRRA
jgi:tripartite-type tricarboxylate transporter receptor subunit TctC